MAAGPPRVFTLSFGLAAAFASGIAAFQVLPFSPSVFSIIFVGCGGAFWGLKRSRLAASPGGVLALSACAALAVATAGSCVAARTHRIYSQAPLRLRAASKKADPQSVIRVRGWVSSQPALRLDRLRFELQVEEVETSPGWIPCRGIVRVSVRAPAPAFQPDYGSRWEMPLRLRPPRSFRNPGAYDYRLSLEAEGIHLLASLKSSLLAHRLPGTEGSAPVAAIQRLRQRWKARLEGAFPEQAGLDSRRFLAAILLGERDGGEGRADVLFRKTGVYHILSISGMHFALLLGLLRLLGSRLPMRVWTQPALLALVGGFYVVLSGGEDPILRCALAAALQEMGSRAERRISAWDAQSLAAVALMAVHPAHLFTPGFQLSFLATWGILALGGGVVRGPAKLRWVARSLKASLGAWTASTPLMAAWFLQVSPIALPLNLVAAPFLVISMVLGGLLLIHPCALIAECMQTLFDTFSLACAAALRVPGACLRVPSPGFGIAAALGALLLARLQLRGKMESRFLGGAVLAAMALLMVPPDPWLPPDRLSITALDVGQGDAILVGLPGPKWVLVDAGGFASGDFDVGERVVLPALMSLGVRRLETAVLTHAHQDHGGGLPAIVEAFAPREIWLGGAPEGAPLVRSIATHATQRGIPMLHPTAGELSCYAESCLEVLHPPAASLLRAGRVANNDSLVLRVTFGSSGVLLTGDLEAEGEATLLPLLASRQVQILKVAHHGSASSTSSAFLSAVSPSVAIISVGEGNPWGHPSSQVLERLQARHIAIGRTDRDGAIRWESDGRNWRRVSLAVPP